jgi:hypothetical protein
MFIEVGIEDGEQKGELLFGHLTHHNTQRGK